jgi:hypothetical protein
MYETPLDVVPLWALFLIVGVLGWLGMEVGYRAGTWRHARLADEKETPVGAMVGAILGLLAFMLAFTFSMAASRFDDRRRAVLDEANAIGTAFLRTELLPEPQRSEAAKLLREYVTVRVRGMEEHRVEQAVVRSEELQQLLWSQAMAEARNDPRSVMVGLFVQSVNELIDLHSTRIQAGLRSRIPAEIWTALTILALLGMASVGYHAGLSATRRSPAMLVLVLAFAGVLMLIADLDRGSEGFLTVSQQALIDVQRSMQLPESTGTHP